VVTRDKVDCDIPHLGKAPAVIEERIAAGRRHVLIFAPVSAQAQPGEAIIDTAGFDAVIVEVARHGPAGLIPGWIPIDEHLAVAGVLEK